MILLFNGCFYNKVPQCKLDTAWASPGPASPEIISWSTLPQGSWYYKVLCQLASTQILSMGTRGRKKNQNSSSSPLLPWLFCPKVSFSHCCGAPSSGQPWSGAFWTLLPLAPPAQQHWLSATANIYFSALGLFLSCCLFQYLSHQFCFKFPMFKTHVGFFPPLWKPNRYNDQQNGELSRLWRKNSLEGPYHEMECRSPTWNFSKNNLIIQKLHLLCWLWTLICIKCN